MSSDPPMLSARNLLAQRLVTRHGIDPLEAHTAVTRLHLGMPTEHEQLIREEAAAVVAEFRQALIEAFAPVNAAMKALVEAVAHAMAQLHQATNPVLRPRSRPAWQSPYGPPRKGQRS
ncbi:MULTISPECIES: hypothetical protein [unclassified Streptomyces]|uniref:hypothetical protein n=1 Tax=unclassified Streptomyces TaxID=2593676 RepID=UPI003332F5EB